LLIYVLCFGCQVTYSWQLVGTVKRIFTAYHRKHCTVTFNLRRTMEDKGSMIQGVALRSNSSCYKVMPVHNFTV